MTGKEIFEELLKDPMLEETYGLTEDKLQKMTLHEETGSEVVEILKLMVRSIEGNTPSLSVNSMIKTRFKI